MAFDVPKIVYGSLIPTTISFDYPPRDDGELFDSNEVQSVSLSGVRQVSHNYVEVLRKVTFGALTEAQVTSLKSFFSSWAYLGKSFKYYEDEGDVDYTTYELKDVKLSPKRTSSAGANVYLYSLELLMRRVLGVTAREGYLEIELLNNQSSAVSISGQLLDSASYKSVKIFFEIFRKTTTEERIVNGFITATYNETLGAWDVTPAGTYDGNAPHGVEFSISAAGQLKYTSDNMGGSSYEGTLKMFNFTIEG